MVIFKLYPKRGYDDVQGLIFVNGWVSFRGVFFVFLESISNGVVESLLDSIELASVINRRGIPALLAGR